jgi:hypothetical protein
MHLPAAIAAFVFSNVVAVVHAPLPWPLVSVALVAAVLATSIAEAVRLRRLA